MLRLRKILLYDILYIIILILVLFISFFRIMSYKEKVIPKSSSLVGMISDYFIDGNKLSVTVKGEFIVNAIYYFEYEKDIDYFIDNYLVGDIIEIYGEYSYAPHNRSKYLFDYNEYLRRNGVDFLFWIDSFKKIRKSRNLYYKIYNLIRKRCLINPYLSTFILGDNRYLSEESISSFRECGISHLFAISGMHISLMSSILLKILKKMKFSEEKSFVFVSIFLIFYLFLVGIGASILRGVLFFILFSLNRIKYFYIKKHNLFIIILSISLLINPYFIYDVGFLYSFVISFSLIMMGAVINKYNGYLKKLFMTSLISFVVSLPISLFSFYQVNLLSIIYNLFYVPYVSFILFPVSIISLFFDVGLLKYLVFILEESSLFLSKIDTFKFVFMRVDFYFYILYYLSIIIFFYRLGKGKVGGFLFLILVFIHFLCGVFQSDFIKMIDVGQGDSILVYSKGEAVLFDTGGVMYFNKDSWKVLKHKNSLASNTLIPVIKSMGIKKLDYLVLTHGDCDHMCEAYNLLSFMKVRKILLNSNHFNYLERNLINKFFNYSIGEEGYQFSVGNFSFVEVNKKFNDENASSQVYYVVNNGYSMLFTGDASVISEEYILNNYDIGHVDILKVGHHGSRTSTSEILLDNITPSISLISAGVDNKFLHPHKEVVNRLALYKSQVYCTKDLGTITIRFNNGIKIENEYKKSLSN